MRAIYFHFIFNRTYFSNYYEGPEYKGTRTKKYSGTVGIQDIEDVSYTVPRLRSNYSRTSLVQHG